MRNIFIADAHLHQPEDSNYRLLLRFIESLQGTTDTLCILGDLFDFRIGLSSLSFPEHEPLLKALERLRAAGTRLIYLEGNHDFQLGVDLAMRLDADIYTGPVTLNLQGKKIFLCHGDLVNSADWRYRILHRVLRSRVTLFAGNLLPQSALLKLRKKLQLTSKGRYKHDRVRWDYRSIIRNYAAAVQEMGCEILVLGHFHLPFAEKQGDFTLVSLGDWISHFSFAEMVDGEIRLLTYPD